MKKYTCILITIAAILTSPARAQPARRALLKDWVASTIVGTANYDNFRHFIITPDGTVDSFFPGRSPHVFPDIDNVAAIQAGAFHILALRKDGTVWAWGGNDRKQIGNKESIKLNIVQKPAQVTELQNAVAISADASNSYALLADGTVWAWGASNLGQTGDGKKIQGRYSSASQPLPARIQGVSNAIAIAGAMALLKDGTVVTWGDGSFGRLGNGTKDATSVPTSVPGIKNAVAISSGRDLSLVLLADGTVWGWGDNAKGQLGYFDPHKMIEENYNTSPVQIKSLHDIVAISAGATCLALARDGTLYAWGWGAVGGMGSGRPGTYDVNATPRKVPVPSNIIGIKGGNGSGFAMLSDGTLWGWGGDMVPAGVYHQTWKPVVVAKFPGVF